MANSWNIPFDGPPMFRVLKKLKEVCSVLCKWNKQVVRNLHENVQKLLAKAASS